MNGVNLQFTLTAGGVLTSPGTQSCDRITVMKEMEIRVLDTI